jgi:hypothetical protein
MTGDGPMGDRDGKLEQDRCLRGVDQVLYLLTGEVWRSGRSYF